MLVRSTSSQRGEEVRAWRPGFFSVDENFEFSVGDGDFFFQLFELRQNAIAGGVGPFQLEDSDWMDWMDVRQWLICTFICETHLDCVRKIQIIVDP